LRHLKTSLAKTNSMKETFRPIPHLPGFHVSDLGRIRKGAKTFPALKVNHRGAKVLRTCIEGVYSSHMAARLVYTAFVGDCEGLVVLHRDGDKLNCAASNLYTVPKSEVMAKARKVCTFDLSNSRKASTFTTMSNTKPTHRPQAFSFATEYQTAVPGITYEQVINGVVNLPNHEEDEPELLSFTIDCQPNPEGYDYPPGVVVGHPYYSSDWKRFIARCFEAARTQEWLDDCAADKI